MHKFEYIEKDTFYNCVYYAEMNGMSFYADATNLTLTVYEDLHRMDVFEFSEPVYNITIH